MVNNSIMHSYAIQRIMPRIYFVNFADSYELAMTFCRYQEFYESPNHEIRGKKFTLVDFMEYYSKAFGEGCFTYAKDWAGFNLPGKCIKQCYPLIEDLNKYDLTMWEIYSQCLADGEPYLIGAVGAGTTFDHELAHGLYSINEEYRAKMDQLIQGIDLENKALFTEYLEAIGYVDEVFEDEIQAYMATGLTENLAENEDLVALTPEFEKVFQAYAPINKNIAIGM